MVENPLPKCVDLAYSNYYFKNSQLFERYDHVFEDEIFRIRVMVVFPKLDELVEQPKGFWFGYYPYSMDPVYNERLIDLRTHLKKRMIVGRIFS